MATVRNPHLQPPPPDPAIVQVIEDFYRDSGTIEENITVQGYNEKPKDFDGNEMKFFKCTYKVGPITFNRFIKRGAASSKDWASDYHFVKALEHPAVIQVENYFRSECVIISQVDGSFSKWLDDKTIELFSDGTMLPILRNMVIQLASLVGSILAKRKYPRGTVATEEFSMKELYIKLLPDKTPKLQVLILKVGDIGIPAHAVQAWTRVREIVRECFERRGVTPSNGSQDFISCIGVLTKNTQALLEGHPDQWDNSQKGGFLMESYTYSQLVSGRINRSELRWPVEGDGATPWLLWQLILRGQEKKVFYDKNFPYDYVKLCRHSYKHFNKLPNNIKHQLGGSTDGLLRQIEKWSPSIWHIMYVALHKPGPSCK